MMGLIISYILALQYGGQTHPWKSSQVIGLLVGFVLLVAVFILWEIYQKERAMIVPRLVCPSTPQIYFPANGNLTVPRALRLGRLDLHVLLRRRLLRRPLLPPHLLPKHPQRQPHQLGRQNARLDHPLDPLCNHPRLCPLKNWHRAFVLDHRGRNSHDRGRTLLYHGYQYLCCQVDWLSNPRWLCHWSYIPSRYC
jgi:hypothetical protein